MDKFKPNKKKINFKNIGVAVVTGVFAIIGLICIIIGYKDEMAEWVRTFGIVILVITFPIFVFVVFNMILRKVKEM